jgi:hypothetical protein
MYPRANKERPRKRDDSPDTCHCNKAIPGETTIRLDNVVETNRRSLHQAERHHGEADLQTHPALWRRVLRYEAEDERTERSNEERG